MFWYVTLPIARRGIGAGIALSFAHTIGEFGVVLMLGGSIPGVTRVASIALYDEVQKLNYSAAHSIRAPAPRYLLSAHLCDRDPPTSGPQ